jgi:hypothetical protein
MISIISCSVEPELEPAREIPDDEVKVVKNPYATDNILTALNNVAARSGGRIKVDPPPTTHNYVRFEPQNLNQIMQIYDLGYELWDEPLDQNIDNGQDYYQQPGIPDSLNYFYTLIPVNYSIEQTVPHTILGQVILFDEDAGDEQDPEDDPWIPDPDNCPDPYNPNCPCYEGPCARTTEDGKVDLREDLVKKTTKYLLDAGVNLIELYNEAMLLAGYPEEVIDDTSNGRTQSVRYYPSGVITVHDNTLNTNVPVKNVQVKARRLFKIKSTWTTDAGSFYINKGYRQKATIIVKFKNNLAKVRGINGALKVWQYVLPVRKKIGLRERNDLENIRYTFTYSANANSLTALQWSAAHCLNTLADTRQYLQNNNLTGFAPGTEYSLRIWISSVITDNAAAPMLRAIANTSLVSNVINYLLPLGASSAKRVLQNYLPDITLRLQNSSGNTRIAGDLNGTFFHEFGHTTHYNQVGNNYWVNLISAIVTNNGYGTKTSNNVGYVAVAESWGFFIGPTFTRIRYSSNTGLSNERLDFLEKQRNDNSLPVSAYNASLGYSRGWIPWGMHHDLIDGAEPSITLITDQVNGYTINGIFKGFHQGSTSIQNLKAAILANNNNRQATQVNTLVAGYGW